MARPISLTANEVAMAAQLAGVPATIAVALWQQGGLGKTVDSLHDGLASLAEEYRSTNNWTEAATNYFKGFDGSGLEQEEPDDLGMERMDDVSSMGDLGSEENMPRYTSQPMQQINYNNFDPNLNRMGSNNYDMDRYIRKLVEEEFSNGR